MKQILWKQTASILLAVVLTAGFSSVLAAEAAPDPFSVAVPEGEVTFHTQVQQEALEAGADHISEYSNLGKDEFSIPEGIVIEWSYDAETQPESFTVAVSESEDMADAQVYEVPGDDGEYSYAIQNLLLGTTYYVTISAGNESTDVYSFTTSDQGPRNLYVDGVTNVRDLGGWSTADGGKIRQGLLFRCGELSIAETTDPCITPDGIAVMRDVLDVKTEIDLRRTEDNEQGGITESPLGSDIQYYSEPIGYITDVTPDLESIAEIFRLMSDENNYPIIYHCKIGTDRTGLISYLLLTLCDVPMEEVYVDYAFSNLGVIQGKRDPKRLDKMVNDNLAAFEGETRQETARNFLKSVGLTDEELDSIVSILVEK